MHALGYLLQAICPVVHRVHGCHVCQENLRGADVGRRLVKADVLLARLQGEPVGRVAEPVHRFADDAAGHPAHLLLGGREVGRRRPAEPHRHPKPLHRADDDVRPKLAGRLGDDESQGVRRHDEVRPVLVECLPKAREVLQQAAGVGVLHERTAELRHGGKVIAVVVADDELHTEVLGACPQHVDRLGVHFVTHEELVLGLRVHGPGNHCHGLRCRGALVEQGGIGDLHAGQLADERLEVHQRLQAALGYLGLVGGVCRVPTWVLEEVAEDGAGHVRAVVAHAYEVLGDDVLREDRLDQGERPGLAQLSVGQVERDVAPHLRRDRLLDEVLKIANANDAAHFVHVPWRRAKVPVVEGVGWRQQFLDVHDLGATRGRRRECLGGWRA
mmetsp:Transcript_49430/g.137383  ORF Transcript_49430/g.137383 Transcript_49430/m.137383 type:complete len:386 (-) Transcript_49430:331-1488(-)